MTLPRCPCSAQLPGADPTAVIEHARAQNAAGELRRAFGTALRAQHRRAFVVVCIFLNEQLLKHAHDDDALRHAVRVEMGEGSHGRGAVSADLAGSAERPGHTRPRGACVCAPAWRAPRHRARCLRACRAMRCCARRWRGSVCSERSESTIIATSPDHTSATSPRVGAWCGRASATSLSCRSARSRQEAHPTPRVAAAHATAVVRRCGRAQAPVQLHGEVPRDRREPAGLPRRWAVVSTERRPVLLINLDSRAADGTRDNCHALGLLPVSAPPSSWAASAVCALWAHRKGPRRRGLGAAGVLHVVQTP